jgi:hypothetical protein
MAVPEAASSGLQVIRHGQTITVTAARSGNGPHGLPSDRLAYRPQQQTLKASGVTSCFGLFSNWRQISRFGMCPLS